MLAEFICIYEQGVPLVAAPEPESGMQSERRQPLDVTILYVEDELITRATIHRMLKVRYRTILLAGDGKEGLELFRLHKPDIVLTDTRMPVMDGLRMSRAIRETDPLLPIIFITANEDADFLEETRRLGVTRNIIKPIMLKELFAALDEVIERAGHRSGQPGAD